MGNCCTSNKDFRPKRGSSQILIEKYQLKVSRDSQVNKVFEPVQDLLSGVIEAKERVSQAQRTLKKKTLKAGKGINSLENAIKIMLVAYSACCSGEFSNIQLRLDTNDPFISIDRFAISPDFLEFSNGWEDLLSSLRVLPSRVQRLEQELPGLMKLVEQNLQVIMIDYQEQNREDILKIFTDNQKIMASVSRMLEAVKKYHVKVYSEIKQTMLKLIKKQEELKKIGQEVGDQRRFSQEQLNQYIEKLA